MEMERNEKHKPWSVEGQSSPSQHGFGAKMFASHSEFGGKSISETGLFLLERKLDGRKRCGGARSTSTGDRKAGRPPSVESCRKSSS